jgi:hypothetical protein
MERPATKVPRDLGIIGGLIFGPLLLLAALLTPVWLPVVMGEMWLREKAFIRLMKKRGRYMAWPDVAEKLRAGEGTAILDQINKLPPRLWWTADDVGSLSPHPLPHDDDLPYFPLPELPPFVAWCYARYLNPVNGLAILTSADQVKYTGPFLTAADLQREFPSARACATQRTA